MFKDKYTLTLADDPALPPLIAGFTQLPSLGFTSGEAMLSQADPLNPLAVFVDVHLENPGASIGKGRGGEGLDFIPKFRARWPQAVIIVVTSDDEPELIGKALGSGASDFITKPISRVELLARLKARLYEMTLRGVGEFCDLGSAQFNPRKRFIEGKKNTVYLSPVQTELLQVLFENEGILVPKDKVKKAVWGKIAVSDNALDRRLSELRKILRDSGAEMKLVSEYGKGISLQRIELSHSRSLGVA